MPSSYARLTVAALFCLLGAPAALADPSSDTSPFTEAEVLNGKMMSEDDCSRLVGAVWVVVDGRGDCMRYWLSTAGGDTKQALLYLHGDVVLTIGSKRSASQTYLKVSPAKLSEQAAEWSKRRKGTYIYLARPGAYGSSGNHSQRRRIREVRLVDAALDAIREKHGIERFHLVGQSGGGHLVASVLPLRDDVGCAVITSGVISVRTRTKDLGRSVDPTGFTDPYDPIVDLDRIAKPDGFRIFVLTDPDDKRVSMRSQVEYVTKATEIGLPIAQIFAAAKDEANHSLSAQGMRAALDCMQGVATDAIVKKYTNKLPKSEGGDVRQAP